MRQISAAVILTTVAVLTFCATATQAQTFATLHSFTGGSDGGNPYAGVVQDPSGNLYGTTGLGGNLTCYAPYGCGVVYKLDSSGTESVLHSFSGPDGEWPYAPVVRDKAGNLYGTTYSGGPGYRGTVFKIDTAGKETVLYSFTGSSDGCSPLQGLIADKSGTLFGTTAYCGSSGYGTIFKVDSAGNFTLLHSLAGPPSDGAVPWDGHLTMDTSGNLYGVTPLGGSGGCRGGCGVLYKLSKNGKFTLLHSFSYSSSDGCFPYGSVVQDTAGNLYGTTSWCGSNGLGTIWKVSKKGKETILHNFAGGSSDGCIPDAGVTRDSKGNLYGVASGCAADDWGALYELSASGTFTLLHSFDGADGDSPGGEVLRTTKGVLLGTTLQGGSGQCYGGDGCGTAWQYVP